MALNRLHVMASPSRSPHDLRAPPPLPATHRPPCGTHSPSPRRTASSPTSRPSASTRLSPPSTRWKRAPPADAASSPSPDRKPAMSKIVIVTGASSGFGALTSRALADAGYVVYAGIRETGGRNAPAVADARAYAEDHDADLRTVELDVSDQASVDAAVAAVIEETGAIDVVVHNAGHMVLGPSESFTPEQLAQIYDTNVLSTQRVNRAVLPS